jgi:hypothetical protein
MATSRVDLKWHARNFDELRDYHVDVYVVGSHILKANLSPSPRTRHNYFITSFEKVPGHQ